MSDFKLEPSDRTSPTWIRLEAHLKARIELCHLQNDQDLDPVATAKLRGRITELKALLALSKP